MRSVIDAWVFLVEIDETIRALGAIRVVFALVGTLADRGLDPAAVTSEGLAVYFSPRRVVPISLDVLAALNDRQAHDAAGTFVGYLVRSHGLEEVLAFHRTTHSGMTDEEFSSLVEERFGTTVGELEDAIDQELREVEIEVEGGVSSGPSPVLEGVFIWRLVENVSVELAVDAVATFQTASVSKGQWTLCGSTCGDWNVSLERQ